MRWIIRHRTLPHLFLDFIAFQAAIWAIFYLRFITGWIENPQVPTLQQFFYMDIALTIYWHLVFLGRGDYARKIGISRYDAIANSTKSALIGTILLFILFFEYGEQVTMTRMVLIVHGVMVAAFSGINRALFNTLIRFCFSRRIGLYHSVIVGYGSTGQNLYNTLRTGPEFGYDVLRIFTADNSEKKSVPDSISHSSLDKLEKYLESEEGQIIDYVLIALESNKRDVVLTTLYKITRFRAKVMIVPDFYQILSGLAKTHQLYGVPLLEIFPELLSPLPRLIKRILDIMAAILILVAGFPVMLLVAAGIAIDSRGPILYKQRRVGYRGKEFYVYKFRTMVKDAEKKTGPVWAKENDPRITKIGRFLRAARLDELPQAWNILTGSMSLVGPRPERKVFVDEFAEKIPFYTRRLNVKPGVTGWAQVRRGYDASIEDVKEKLNYDLFYIENLSIGMDVRIILNTIWVVLTMKGQ